MSNENKFFLGAVLAGLSFFAIPERPAEAKTGGACVACNGGAPTVSANNVVVNAEVVPIFWAPWPSGQPTGGQVLGAVEAILNGPYTGALAQYGANVPRISPMTPIFTAQSPPANNFNIQATIPPMINSEITAGAVPQPTAGVDILYVVFLPANLLGCNNLGCGPSFNGPSKYTPTGAGYRFAYVSGNNSLTGVGSYSQLFSHELAECLAPGVSVSGCGSFGTQIGDICNCVNENQMQGAMTVSGYWSVKDKECVLPEAWAGVFLYTGTPDKWTQIGGAARQVYAGSGGVVATDTNDNAYYYTDATNQFNVISGPGAMFANGADGIIALPADLSFVAQWTGGTNWQAISGPGANTVYDGQSIQQSGGSIVATTWAGDPFVFNTNTSKWTQAGGPGDQFVVTNSFLIGLTPDHQNVNVWDGGTTWTTVASAASQIFGGSASNFLGGISFGATKNVSIWAITNGWIPQGGPGSSFATSGNGTSNYPYALIGATPDRSQINESTNLNVSNPPWAKIGVVTGRVVSGGKDTIATGPAVY